MDVDYAHSPKSTDNTWRTAGPICRARNDRDTAPCKPGESSMTLCARASLVHGDDVVRVSRKEATLGPRKASETSRISSLISRCGRGVCPGSPDDARYSHQEINPNPSSFMLPVRIMAEGASSKLLRSTLVPPSLRTSSTVWGIEGSQRRSSPTVEPSAPL